MIYITVSTGIGGGVIVRGRMLLGRQGLAGEIGHVTIDLSAEDAVSANAASAFCLDSISLNDVCNDVISLIAASNSASR